MVEVVNIVAGGDLEHELDLRPLFSELVSLDGVEADFNPESSNMLQLRFEKEGPLCMVYRSGKFVITGAGNNKQLNHNYNLFLDQFCELGILDGRKIDLNIYNMVFTDDLSCDINLSEFAYYLGFEHIEYEPEQAPFLTYRPSGTNGVITLASSGKMVINGIRTREDAKRLKKDLEENLEEFMSVKD
jgi:transcription initiation factor TFIID TATA-box-binding protein